MAEKYNRRHKRGGLPPMLQTVVPRAQKQLWERNGIVFPKPLRGERLQTFLAIPKYTGGKHTRDYRKRPWWTRAGYRKRVPFEPALDWSILEKSRGGRLLTLDEVARLTKRQRISIYSLIRRETIPAARVQRSRGSPTQPMSYTYAVAVETALWLRTQTAAGLRVRTASDRHWRREAILNRASEISS